jgi:hypothetical protein
VEDPLLLLRGFLPGDPVLNRLVLPRSLRLAVQREDQLSFLLLSPLVPHLPFRQWNPVQDQLLCLPLTLQSFQPALLLPSLRVNLLPIQLLFQPLFLFPLPLLCRSPSQHHNRAAFPLGYQFPFLPPSLRWFLLLNLPLLPLPDQPVSQVVNLLVGRPNNRLPTQLQFLFLLSHHDQLLHYF